MNMKYLLLCAFLISSIPFSVSAAYDHLVISQVQIDSMAGTGGTEDDWVEIFNPTLSAVDLSGWSVQKTSASGGSLYRKDLAGSIPASRYFLIVRDHTNTKPELKAMADVLASASSFSLADNNSIYLVSNNENITGPNDPDIMDTLGLGTSIAYETAPISNPLEGGSVLRKGQDTDNNSVDFQFQPAASARNTLSVSLLEPDPVPAAVVPPDPEPLAVIAPVYSSSIKINEFMPDPLGPDSGREWVELYNDSSVAASLNAWKLDDSAPSSGGVGSSVYVLPDLNIGPLSYIVIDLPASAFALNNSGSDAVRLFSPDGQPKDQVLYQGGGLEGYSYAKTVAQSFARSSLPTRGAANLFPIEDSDEVESELTDDEDIYPDTIRINEIFPDPAGTDGGNEWIEVTNVGDQPIYMHNWIIDDGELDDKIGSSAYQLKSPTVSAGGFVVIMIPSGKFAMNNKGTETIRIFDPAHNLIDHITYTDTKEDLSYQKFADKWIWSDPTPEEENVQGMGGGSADIVINELLPEPSQSEEFIELYNRSEADVDLAGWQLSDSSTNYDLTGKISAGGFLVVLKSDSKIALNNSGIETVTLSDPSGETISEVEFEDAPKDQSYNLTVKGDYAWSIATTSGKINVIKVGVVGKVKGKTLPRTGSSWPIDMWQAFAVFVIFWYILVCITDRKTVLAVRPLINRKIEQNYEQTRTDRSTGEQNGFRQTGSRESASFLCRGGPGIIEERARG